MDTNFVNLLKTKCNLILNPQQVNAMSHHNGPGLVLAVPGSGKTTMLICRTVNLILNHQVNPNRILTLTFSKSAAIDMQRRYNDDFKRICPHSVLFSTIHRFCYSVINNYSKVSNINYTLLEGGKSNISKQRIIHTIYNNLTSNHLSEDLYEEMQSGISFVKNMMIDPKELEDYRNKVEFFPQVFEAYEAYKEENQLIDFDDMLTKCLEFLKATPQLLNFYRAKFDFIQVDETQDTSKVQHEIIRLLSQGKGNLFMVADDDQSIYRFRGAFPEMLLAFKNIYPDGTLYFLETNYRSSKEIIDVCSKVITFNKSRYAKTFMNHHGSASNIKVLTLSTLGDKCKYISDTIKKEKNKNKEIAVLFRNNISAIPVINALNLDDIEFHIQDKKQHFFRHMVTQDIKAFLSLALINNDIESFERVYYKVNGYISKNLVAYVKGNIGVSSIFETLVKNPQLKDFQRDGFKEIQNKFNYLAKLAPLGGISYIERELGYMTYLKTNCKRFGQSIDSIIVILDTLKAIAETCSSTVDFLNRLESLKPIIRSNSNNSLDTPVKLMTIHSSKGLEFDKVILIDASDSIFPSRKSVELIKESDHSLLEEERRLFYVALSRAKSELEILHTQFRNGNYLRPSKFVQEVLDTSEENIDIIKVK